MKQGEYYWCVKTSQQISKTGELYLNADGVKVTNNGDLVFTSNEKFGAYFSISAGNWLCFYAASTIDGGAISVEYWDDNQESKSDRNSDIRQQVTKSKRFDVLKRDGYKCKICGSDDRLEIDHIVPVSNGGSSHIDNLQVLCFSCNRGKRDKDL